MTVAFGCDNASSAATRCICPVPPAYMGLAQLGLLSRRPAKTLARLPCKGYLQRPEFVQVAYSQLCRPDRTVAEAHQHADASFVGHEARNPPAHGLAPDYQVPGAEPLDYR